MNLKTFETAEFGAIRTAEINNDVWFVGKDVAEVLGYVDTNKAIAMHVDEDDKLNDKTSSSLGQRGGWFINESGLYSLVLSSKLPTAKAFKRWVTSEVLPSIRKHGMFAKDSTTPTQKAMELGLFEIVVRTVERGNGLPIETKTIKVTGKGQIYFVNKFLPKNVA